MMDSSEKGSKIDVGAQRTMRLRSEAGLQGARTATLGSDESAEIWGDRVVTDGISRPMATDGKGEEHSPTNCREKNQNRSINRLSKDINNQADEGSDILESKTLNKVDLEQTTFKMKNQKNDREKNEQEPVVTLRGTVSVGEADRVNTE